MRSPHEHRFQILYEVRIQLGIIVALLLCLGVVHGWPAPTNAPDDRIYTSRVQDAIEIEEIQQTRQSYRPPPPPPPPVPVIVPNDNILEEVPLDFNDTFLQLPDLADDLPEAEGDPEVQTTSLERVETAPKPVRIVEPAYTREAQRRKVRAEVVVEVLVNERGRVEESRIVERFMLGKDNDDPKEPVAKLGYGLEEAAVAAAERWIFRPARQDGRPVSSYTTVTLVFGV